jgi:hypothetical protein
VMSLNTNLFPSEQPYDGIIVESDVETDDVALLAILAPVLAQHKNVLVIVGEGKCIKTGMMRNLLDSLGLQHVETLQGTSSEKDYPAEMLFAFGAIDQSKNDERSLAMRAAALARFVDKLTHPLIILAKPPHEFLTLTDAQLKNATVVVYGSFNFRSLSNEEKDRLLYLLNEHCARVVLYESYLATGLENSVTPKNSLLFEHMRKCAADATRKDARFWRGFQDAMLQWNKFIAADCLETVAQLSSQMLDYFEDGNWAELRAKKRRIEERNWKVVANIIDAESQQMVFADCAMAAAIIGTLPVRGLKGKISFDQETRYTVPIEDPTGRVFVFTGTAADFAPAVARMTDLMISGVTLACAGTDAL